MVSIIFKSLLNSQLENTELVDNAYPNKIKHNKTQTRQTPGVQGTYSQK